MRKQIQSRVVFSALFGLFLGMAPLFLSGCPFATPTAAFTASPTEGDAPLTVNFIDQSLDGGADITSWLWDFGDGSQSVDQSPVHVYTTNGFYRVTLRVANNNGTSTETKEAFINVKAIPDADFTASPRSGNTPLTVQFEDTSITAPFEATAWRWTFGDGEVSTERSPAHTYVQPGEYNVSLTVTSDGGTNTITRNRYITAAQLPAVQFDATPVRGAAPLDVRFTDTSIPGSAPIDSWTWVFGDGGTSNEQSPTHRYETPGIYSVSLTTRTAAGEITGTMNNLITVTQAPTAAFSASPTSGGAPLVVQFVDESLPGTAPITSWLWDFGDGTSSVQRNPIHEFTEAGEYDIVLTVTTDAGTNSITKADLISVQATPTAGFTASVLRGTVPLTVSFLDASTAGATPISGRQWNFGDATTSGETNPVHTYTQPGIYTVSLLVQSAVGSDIHIETAFIEVVSTPDADFSATPTQGESPLTVTFSDTSLPGTSPITAWLWDFGDGTTSDAQNPTRIYTNVGTYTVKLTVTTTEGSDTQTRIDYVAVQQRPDADFSATVTQGTAPLSVQFRDESSPGSERITGRVWDFGDGNTSTAEDPVHVYREPGIYTVTLNLDTTSGPESERKQAYIQVDPAVTFTASPATGQAPAFVTFTDTTATGTLTITGRTWDFGDGESSDAMNPVHQYTAPGSYDVTLTLSTSQGDVSLTKRAAVNLRPTPSFTGEPRTAAGGPLEVQFEDTTDAGSLTLNGWDWNFGDGGHSALQNPTHTFQKPGLYAVSLTVLTDIGNSATTRTGYVSIRPEAAFSADVTNGAGSLAVQFTDETDPGNLAILSRQWDFGDGASSTLQNPSHTYSTPGTYTVSLTTTSSEGPDTETKAGYIVVTPLVRFTANVVRGVAPLDVTFVDRTDAGGLTISKRTWDVGEGDPIEEGSPTYSYTVPGLYDVTLTVTTTQGDAMTTRAGFVQVLPVLTATTEITDGMGTASVVFTNATDVGNYTDVSWLWDFGDGNTSTAESPTHTFSTPGVFEVTLTILTGEEVTTTTTVATITVDPIPSFSTDTTMGVVPLAVQFTDTSNVGTATVSNWAWDFGDGNTSTAQNPVHTYTSAGSFDASLTITTEAGDSTVAMPTTIQVIPAPDFSATPLSGPPTLAVAFTDTTNLGGATLNSVLWNFGDGGTSTDASPTHNYTTPGTYTVSLTVNTSEGTATETKTDFIAVNPIPTFTASATSGASPFTVNFTDTTNLGSVTPTAYAWNFGDGGTSSDQNPSHTYVAAGVYSVTMIITSAQGQVVATETDLITVTPDVQLSTSASSGPTPLTVTLTDTTVIGNLTVTDWVWNFGDGTGTVTTQTNSTSHTYTAPGNYTPTLTIVTSGGNFSGSLAAPIMANPVPTFSADYRSGPGTFTVTFTDNTAGGSVNTTSRAWDFGDGSTTTTANTTVSHTYSTAGTYDVTMDLTTDIQGMLSKTEVNYITAHPLSYAVTGGTSGTVTHAITVSNTTPAGDLPILTTQWNYGDGTAQTPATSHSYTAAGSYTLSMIVSTVQGSQTYTGITPINVAPVVSFTTDVDEGPAVMDVLFTDTTTPDSVVVTSRTWDFGDGTSVVVNAPTTTVSHQYTNTGTNTAVSQAKLTLNTNIGDVESATAQSITLHPINFSGNVTNQPHDLNVTFTDNTTVGDLTITSRNWDFKDTDTATTAGNTTSHLYVEPGNYPVELTITTSQGNMATGTISSNILVRPVVKYFETSAVKGPKPHTVNFEDQTFLGNLTGVSRRWTWGDGTTTTVAGTTTSHTYTTAGCFDATMELLTNEGTFSDNSFAVRVTAEEISTFTPPTTPDNSQAGIMFDLNALKNLRVDSITLNFSTSGQTANVRTYASASSSIGNENNAGVWAFQGDLSVTTSTATEVDIPNITMSSGNRFGFYLLNTLSGGTSPTLRYQTASTFDSFNDGNIRIFTNAGRALGSANDFDGAIFSPRHFVGSIQYIHELTCNLKSGGLALQANARTAHLGPQPTDQSSVYPEPHREAPTAITPDGGRVSLGNYSALGGQYHEQLLIKTNAQLDVLWELDLEGYAFDSVQDIDALPGGDLILSGSTSLDGLPGEALLVRVDSDGNLLWEQVLPEVDAPNLRAIVGTTQGDLAVLVAQPRENGAFEPTVYRLDAYSNLLWTATLPPVYLDAGWGIAEGGDGSLLIYGSTVQPPEDTTAWTQRLLPDGTLAPMGTR